MFDEIGFTDTVPVLGSQGKLLCVVQSVGATKSLTICPDSNSTMRELTYSTELMGKQLLCLREAYDGLQVKICCISNHTHHVHSFKTTDRPSLSDLLYRSYLFFASTCLLTSSRQDKTRQDKNWLDVTILYVSHKRISLLQCETLNISGTPPFLLEHLKSLYYSHSVQLTLTHPCPPPPHPLHSHSLPPPTQALQAKDPAFVVPEIRVAAENILAKADNDVKKRKGESMCTADRLLHPVQSQVSKGEVASSKNEY